MPLVSALFLALATLSGCVRGPLAAPSPQMFLVAPAPRTVGPLQPASESEVRIRKQEALAGTVAMETTSLDMDAMVRIGNESRSIDVRFTEHQGRVRRVVALDATEEASSRFRIDYLRDEAISLMGDERSTETSPTSGKSYLVEVTPLGARVSAPGGSSEVDAFVDSTRYVPLVSAGNPSDEPLSAELVARAARESLVREGIDVQDVKASLIGIREIGGARCAIFHVRLVGSLERVKPDERLSIEMSLSGEYAVRLADGWDAELFLTGTTRLTGSVEKYETSIPVNAAGLARLHIAVTYRLPPTPAAGAVASRNP
jgi:hypothetical protein